MCLSSTCPGLLHSHEVVRRLTLALEKDVIVTNAWGIDAATNVPARRSAVERGLHMVCLRFLQGHDSVNTVHLWFAIRLHNQTQFVYSLLMVCFLFAHVKHGLYAVCLWFAQFTQSLPPPNSKVDSSSHLLIRCGRVVPERVPWQRQRRRPSVTVDATQPPTGAAARQCFSGTGSLSGAAAKRAGPGRCRLDPVELDHHLTLPKSREAAVSHWR